MELKQIRKALAAAAAAAVATLGTGFGQALVKQLPVDRNLVLGLLGGALVAATAAGVGVYKTRNGDKPAE